MAKALASQGANIVALAHRKEKLDQVVVDLKKEYDIDAYTIASISQILKWLIMRSKKQWSTLDTLIF